MPWWFDYNFPWCCIWCCEANERMMAAGFPFPMQICGEH